MNDSPRVRLWHDPQLPCGDCGHQNGDHYDKCGCTVSIIKDGTGSKCGCGLDSRDAIIQWFKKELAALRTLKADSDALARIAAIVAWDGGGGTVSIIKEVLRER